MEIFLLTAITIVVTVLANPLSKKLSNKVDDKKYLKVHIHHSITGLLTLAVGLIFANKIVISLGLGMYLAHGLEEMYYNKKHFPKAFFIFVTR